MDNKNKKGKSPTIVMPKILNCDEHGFKYPKTPQLGLMKKAGGSGPESPSCIKKPPPSPFDQSTV